MAKSYVYLKTLDVSGQTIQNENESLMNLDEILLFF